MTVNELMNKLEKIKNQECLMLKCPVVQNNIKKDNKIIDLKKENQELKATIQKLKDELIGDRMEQFDDYVIYLQNKYLEMLGEKDD